MKKKSDVLFIAAWIHESTNKRIKTFKSCSNVDLKNV